jgi:predicted nucleic acid-binding protein
MKIYLDACCLNRLTDDQNQPRIRKEAWVVEQVFKLVRDGTVQWISSDALADEIDRNPDLERKSGNVALFALASEIIAVNDQIARRARELHKVGYGVFDALHLACAEAARVDVVLTTDDSFVRKASRGDGRPRVAVRNPLSWSQENLP